MGIKGQLINAAVATIGKVATQVLDRNDNSLPSNEVPATAAKIQTEVKAELADQQIAVVKVRSAWLSKINWKSALALVAMLLSTLGIDIPAELQVKILAGLMGASEIYNIVVKTWFTDTVTPQSNTGA